MSFANFFEMKELQMVDAEGKAVKERGQSGWLHELMESELRSGGGTVYMPPPKELLPKGCPCGGGQ